MNTYLTDPHSRISLYLIKVWELIILIGAPIAAYLICVACGERGFFAFDQSIVFDGGYRILSGQVPYHDFVSSHGIPVFFIQALLFKIFGVNYFTAIFGAAVINVLATLLVMLLIRLLFPGQALLLLISGALTAIWFYPPFGTLYPEQSSFFFFLAAIYLTTLAIREHLKISNTTRTALFISGVMIVLGALCKQNVALVLGPLPFLLILFRGGLSFRKIFDRIAWLAGGIFSALAFLAIYLFVFANPSLFLRHYFLIPLGLGLKRFAKEGSLKSISSVIYGETDPLYIGLGLAALILLVLLVAIKQSKKKAEKGMIRWKLRSSLLICIYLAIALQLFLLLMNNNPTLGLAYIGMILALALGIYRKLNELNQGHSKSTSIVLHLTTIFITLMLCLLGWDRSYERREQEGVSRAESFGEYLPVEGLQTLRWGKPTYLSPAYHQHLEEADFIKLTDYLNAQNKRFFIFPDFSLLYGITGLPAPQPFLWFHKGLTYPAEYDVQIDNWIVNSLKKNDVKLIILERDSFFDTQKRLNDFPLLKAYIVDHFKLSNWIGIFDIYTLKNAEKQTLK